MVFNVCCMYIWWIIFGYSLIMFKVPIIQYTLTWLTACYYCWWLLSPLLSLTTQQFCASHDHSMTSIRFLVVGWPQRLKTEGFVKPKKRQIQQIYIISRGNTRTNYVIKCWKSKNDPAKTPVLDSTSSNAKNPQDIIFVKLCGFLCSWGFKFLVQERAKIAKHWSLMFVHVLVYKAIKLIVNHQFHLRTSHHY